MNSTKDSIQVKFDKGKYWPSPLINTKVVPFENNYFDVLKKVIDDIETDSFWFFASFMKLDTFDFDVVPRFNHNINVWYTTHPMGGLNKQGNVFLIPTKEFREQLPYMTKLKQYNLINYNPLPHLEQNVVNVHKFKLDDPYSFEDDVLYRWLIHRDLKIGKPDFYPSFWEDQYAYTYGKTNDVMLLPDKVDWSKEKHFDMEYKAPVFDKAYLKTGDPLDVMIALGNTKTEYFWAIPENHKDSVVDYSFQPDRRKLPRHYKFGEIYLLNKQLLIKDKGKINV